MVMSPVLAKKMRVAPLASMVWPPPSMISVFGLPVRPSTGNALLPVESGISAVRSMSCVSVMVLDGSPLVFAVLIAAASWSALETVKLAIGLSVGVTPSAAATSAAVLPRRREAGPLARAHAASRRKQRLDGVGRAGKRRVDFCAKKRRRVVPKSVRLHSIRHARPSLGSDLGHRRRDT